MFFRKILFLVFLTFLFLIVPSSVSATSYYVAGDTGNDTTGNGSSGTPWKTIQKAAATMVAGDTVNVKGNLTYTGSNNCAIGNSVVCPAHSGSLGNYITYQAWSGTGIPTIDALGQSAGFAFFVTNYQTVRDFYIKNSNSGGVASGIDVYVSNHINIYDNIIANNSSGTTGIGIYESGSSYLNIFNNIIWGNTGSILGAGIYFDSSSPTNVIMKNNILAGNSIAFSGNSWGAGTSGDYNILYGNTLGNGSIYVAGAHDIVGSDPLFVDSSNNNFYLQKTSLAINAGIDLSGSGVTADILGVARPQGSGYDIGAYEYYDIPVTLTTTPTTPSSNTTPTIAGTASTIGAATISSITYSIDSGSWSSTGVTGTSSFSIVVPALADGSHTVRVRATDSYGNVSDSTLYGLTTFTIDTVVKQTGVNNSCSSTRPEGTPIITSITNITSTAVKIILTDPWTTAVDSYFVEYGTKRGVYPYATQSLGGKGTTTVTVSNLTPNTKYYFRIRNGNSCAVGTWSNPKQNTSEVQQDLNTINKTTKTVEITPEINTTQTSVPTTNQNTNMTLLQTIINWIKNVFNKIF